MEVVQKGDYFVIPCREWAAVHLDRDIQYQFRTKGNAWRAIKDDKRNLLTIMCADLMQIYTRLTLAELILFEIIKKVDHYDFDTYVGRSDRDVGSTTGDGSISGTDDSGTGGAAGGAIRGDEETAAGA